MEHDPLDVLRSHPHPPADLEPRVVTAVRLSGAIRRRSPPGRKWLAAMAAAVIFVAGFGTGRIWRTAPATDASTNRTQFMLLLAGDVTPAADGSTRSEEYGAWARSVSATGVSIRGAELAPEAPLIGAAADTPLGRNLTSVGGYFIVEVETEADAVRLAETCPHVKYGGAIQIRRLL